MKVEELRAELEVRAKELGLVFNERMIQLVIEAAENDRRCHCDHERRCPCEHISADVERWGACLCRVLATPAYMEARAKRDAAAKKPKKKGKPKRRELTKAEKKLIGRS
jgi:ferredoxin-thioredoxin reductase catalytic subunit